MRCWVHGCDIDIEKAANWTAVNKLWIETATERPHNFKECYKQSMIKQGKWINYSKPITIIEYPDRWLWPARFKDQLDHLRRESL